MKSSFLFPLLFLTVLLLVAIAQASYTLPVRPIYFPSKNGSYITFATALLPKTFTTLYRDSATRWYFDSNWLTTTTTITINKYFQSNWLNYTTDGAGKTEIYNSSLVSKVYFNNVETSSWTWSAYVASVTTTTSTEVAIYYGGYTPTFYDTMDLFFRSDTHTINQQTCYKLNETNTAIAKNASLSASGNYVVYWGVRVWKVKRDYKTTELTYGTPEAIVYRSTDGQGKQNNTWNTLAISLNVGFDALKVSIYVRFGTGTWTQQASFITNHLFKRTIVKDTWIFTIYTNRTYTGGVTTARTFWGDTTHSSGISGVTFTEPNRYEMEQYHLLSGDIIMAILYPYISLIGNVFYGILLLIICVPLYVRYQKFSPILIIFVLLGGAGGIFTLLIPESGLWVAWVFLLLGLAGLLYRVFR